MCVFGGVFSVCSSSLELCKLTLSCLLFSCSGIMPNVETKVLLVHIFGEKSHPMRKYQRIMYWFPKFKHLNPFPVPKELPQDPVDLARLSLTRIANDLDAQVTVYQVWTLNSSVSSENDLLLF